MIMQKDELISLECKELFSYIIGGDFHKLKEEGWLARNGIDRIKIETPIYWNHDDINVAFNLHAWRFMSAVWAEYVKQPTMKNAFNTVCFNMNIMLDWNLNNAQFNSEYSWYDMGVGIRALHLAFTYFLIDKYSLKVDHIDLLNKMIRDHINWLANINNLSEGNHGLYQIIGLRTLEFVKNSNENESFCVKQISRLIQKAFDENCVNTENSPFYHQYNLQIISKISVKILPTLKDRIHEILSNGHIVTKWLTAPNGDFYRIGDTEGKGVLFKCNDINVSNKIDMNDEEYLFNDISSSGYQIIRSNIEEKIFSSFAFIFYGTNKQNVHRHCDNLSFIYYHQGIELFSDPGKYTYEKTKLKSWFISDISHNTVGLENVPIKNTPLGNTKLNKIIVNDNFFKISGNLKKTDHFFHDRIIHFNPKKTIEINDYIENHSSHNTELRFIFGTDICLKLENFNTVNAYVKREKFLICSLIFDNFLNIKIINDRDNQVFISKTYGEKDSTAQLKVSYSNQVKNIKTKVYLKDRFEHYKSTIKLNSSIINNKLFVEIDFPGKNSSFEYAFYLYVDNEKYLTRWYQDEDFHVFILDKKVFKRALRVRGFIRFRDNNLVIPSKIIKVN